ncbi:hypothetical protein SK128_020809 [Halocaridina rubra]|uniref:Caspase n=1 Tax=Halocaridina rubra TaxID=373956 RepID=A0AAN8WMA4_HALRR
MTTKDGNLLTVSKEEKDNSTSEEPFDDNVTESMSDLSMSPATNDPVNPSNMRNDEADSIFSDLKDALTKGKTKPLLPRETTELATVPPEAVMPVASDSTRYNMHHEKRGYCIIIAYSEFYSGGPGRRDCAPHDVKICKDAFTYLNYNVREFWNLNVANFYKLLDNVREADHSHCDSLVIVFMSHGGVLKNNLEFLWVYDAQVYTNDLWNSFTPKECPSLAGKPKLFFIQACRGDDIDKGVRLRNLRGLSVQTDSTSCEPAIEADYSIPLYADMLMMWASFQGMFAFKSKNYGINGSVFLHFLSKVLKEDARNDDLMSMLTSVTREVAIYYESYVPGDENLHKNKQIPQLMSTLMRKVHFFNKNP